MTVAEILTISVRVFFVKFSGFDALVPLAYLNFLLVSCFLEETGRLL